MGFISFTLHQNKTLCILRYLAERLERVQAEKDLANKMGRRYKEALEASKRIISKENNKEHLKKLLDNATFPVPQPSMYKIVPVY